MFSISSLKVPFFGSPFRKAPAISLPSVEIHDVETAGDKRPRTLKHLLKANHANYSIIYHHLQFHNHSPHILGSAYLLGGTAEHLNDIYEKEAEELEPWRDAPGEISKDDWREFLGKREYQRAFVDFFEDQLVAEGYDWKGLLSHYMFSGKEPLVNSLVSGLGHPLIHLGYAYELNSKTLAIEALAMGSCFYSSLHKYIDDPSYTKPGAGSKSLLEILGRVREDKRFDGLYDHRSGDISKVFEEQEDALLEYWNGWDLSNPKEQFEDSQKAAVALLLATEPPGAGKFDFFIVHTLTSSHAIRILLPLIPAEHHINLVRQWWLFTLAVYITQLRPEIILDEINGYDLEGRNWKHVGDRALKSTHSLDAHFVKGLRAMKVAAETWGDESQYYIKAAVKFAYEFEHWGGFGAAAGQDDVRFWYPQKQ